MAFTLPVFLCLASGFLLVSIGWQSYRSFADRVFVGSLSAGFGLGIFSVVYFLSLLLRFTHPILVDLAVCAVLAGAFLLFRTRSAPATAGDAEQNHRQPPWLHRFATAAFAIALAGALYSAAMRVLAYPHGDGWDAFSIWNLHARFLFRGGSNWRDGFTSLIPWSHPDYPLLLPAAIAHFWTYLGHDAPAVPAIIGFILTFSTVGLLFAALSLLRGNLAALLGATALLATPAFVELGTAQYADVPLSFFVLASVVLVCLYDDRPHNDQSASDSPPAGLLVLAGFAAACAAWTKNEGLLFLCAILAARLITLTRRHGSTNWMARGRRFLPLLIAVVPAFLLIAFFKHSIAPPGDLFSDPSTTLHKLADPARYWAITRWYFKGFFRFGRWLLVPGTILMIGFYFACGKEEHVEPQLGIRTSVLALALTLAGYFAVYLITPYDIYCHLRFSLTRLLLQLWPSAIFLFFLLVKVSPVRDSRGATLPLPLS